MGKQQSRPLPKTTSVTVKPSGQATKDTSVDEFGEQPRQANFAKDAACAVLVVNRNQRVVYANPHIYRYLGHLPQDVTGKTINFLFPKKFHKWHSERFESYIKRQEEGRAWIASDLMDRARIETIITKSGEPIQVVMLLTDMGRQPRAEDPQFILTFTPHIAKRATPDSISNSPH